MNTEPVSRCSRPGPRPAGRATLPGIRDTDTRPPGRQSVSENFVLALSKKTRTKETELERGAVNSNVLESRDEQRSAVHITE
ncbi:hypothetical protein NQ318_015986 [Aromia moschata]|uniref:Uncharacterized protein n=1 Tax=Aromia moschata TaxID=1265417 RepID=A0AAV8X3T2_9CUCU|nr:hypothetical protein NQ318_015986 [Aromia moschata]